MKDKIIGIVVVVIAILIAFSSCSGCSGSGGGNGITSCRNCGRKKSLVPGFGYCSSCYQGFNDWQKRTYGD